MANDGRTESATPKKRKEEREKGNLAKSQDLTTFWSLTALAIIMFFYAGAMTKSMATLVDTVISLTQQEGKAIEIIVIGFVESAKILAPIVLIGTFFHVVNYVIQVKFLFSFKVIKPKWEKVNPKALLNYSKELFTKKKWFDIAKYLILMVILSYVAYFSLNMKVGLLTAAMWMPWEGSLATIFGVFKIAFLALMVTICIIAMADFAFQKWDYEQRIKMKREQVKDEMKTQEGNPLVKSKQRNLMYEFLQKDVANKVPEATFMVNNPTHFSVAVRYKKGEDDIPIVLAKGEDELALYMRTLAKEHKVPMVENKALARSLYFNVESGEYIDEDMFEAVARVLKELVRKGEIDGY